MREKFWYMEPWVVRPQYFRNDHFKIFVANVLKRFGFGKNFIDSIKIFLYKQELYVLNSGL